MRVLILFAVLLASAAHGGPVVVETGELAGLAGALPLDVRKAEAYATGHLPGAANLDVDSLSETRDGVIGMLKLRDDLLPLLAAAGVDPARTVVVYGGMEKADEVKQITRMFWALEYMGYPNVRLLNGGLAKWKAEGMPVESGASPIAPLDVAALAGLTPRADLGADKAQVLSAHDTGAKLLVDLRSREDFSGATKKDFVKEAGHIPGAKSRPATSFVEGPHFTFKSVEAIRGIVGSPEDTGGRAIITYCNSGRDATVGYAAYRIAGFSDVAVYDGSMAEWGNTASCPVAVGEE